MVPLHEWCWCCAHIGRARAKLARDSIQRLWHSDWYRWYLAQQGTFEHLACKRGSPSVKINRMLGRFLSVMPENTFWLGSCWPLPMVTKPSVAMIDNDKNFIVYFWSIKWKKLSRGSRLYRNIWRILMIWKSTIAPFVAPMSPSGSQNSRVTPLVFRREVSRSANQGTAFNEFDAVQHRLKWTVWGRTVMINSMFYCVRNDNERMLDRRHTVARGREWLTLKFTLSCLIFLFQALMITYSHAASFMIINSIKIMSQLKLWSTFLDFVCVLEECCPWLL